MNTCTSNSATKYCTLSSRYTIQCYTYIIYIHIMQCKSSASVLPDSDTLVSELSELETSLHSLLHTVFPGMFQQQIIASPLTKSPSTPEDTPNSVPTEPHPNTTEPCLIPADSPYVHNEPPMEPHSVPVEPSVEPFEPSPLPTGDAPPSDDEVYTLWYIYVCILSPLLVLLLLRLLSHLCLPSLTLPHTPQHKWYTCCMIHVGVILKCLC